MHMRWQCGLFVTLLSPLVKPGIGQVQALAVISHSVPCRHSNETRAPISNLPDSAQIEGTLYRFPNLHLGPCSSVGMWRGTDTQTAVTNTHFASATFHAKCNNSTHMAIMQANL